jgi:hypothetical protein
MSAAPNLSKFSDANSKQLGKGHEPTTVVFIGMGCMFLNLK